MATQKRATNRRKSQRTPFGVPRKKLSVDGYHIPGYTLRFINDTDNRILDAVEGGYQHVSKDEIPNVGDKNVANVEGLGTVVCRRVGVKENGSAMYAYLMKIEEDIYNEDQQMKEEVLTNKEDSLMGGTDIENSYVPRGANHGITRD